MTTDTETTWPWLVAATCLGALVAGCDPAPPALLPSQVTMAEVTTTDFVVTAVPRPHYLKAHGTTLELRPDVEVWVGDQQAVVLGADDDGLHIALSSGLAAGRYDMRLVGPSNLHAPNALEVVRPVMPPVDAGRDGGLDAGDDAGTDGGPDGGTGGDGGTDGGPDGGSDGGPDAGVRSPPCDPSDPDLLICADFEGDGTDSSGRGHTLSMSGTAYVDGVDGRGLELTAGSDCAWTDAPALSPAAFSVSLWMRPASLPAAGARMALFDKNSQFGVFLHPDGSLDCAFGVGRLRAATVLVDVWTHVTCTRASTEAHLYLDGARVATEPAMGDTPTGSEPLTLGQDSPRGGDAFLGRVDQLRFFSRALTEEEVRVMSGR